MPLALFKVTEKAVVSLPLPPRQVSFERLPTFRLQPLQLLIWKPQPIQQEILPVFLSPPISKSQPLVQLQVSLILLLPPQLPSIPLQVSFNAPRFLCGPSLHTQGPLGAEWVWSRPRTFPDTSLHSLPRPRPTMLHQACLLLIMSRQAGCLSGRPHFWPGFETG